VGPLNQQQFKGLSYNELDQHLQQQFHPAQLSATRVPHPKTGYGIESGLQRRLARPPEGSEEGPPVFDVRDYGDPLKEGFNSLKNMLGTPVGQEPVQHVYRGMHADEWNQAQQRGYIQSDQRGTIAKWEGTNAATEPQSAVSYLPFGAPGVVAKIRVKPEDNWFTHQADSYLRTRSPVPLDRVEHVTPISKDDKGYLSVPQFGSS
jgi:hypothetical protein